MSQESRQPTYSLPFLTLFSRSGSYKALSACFEELNSTRETYLHVRLGDGDGGTYIDFLQCMRIVFD